jgi:hypothetical protein
MSQHPLTPTPAPTSPFGRHGIRHLSPSSLALYRVAPALWCLHHLFHIADPSNSFAWRGRAVEAGVDAIIFDGVSDERAIERAKYTFELSAQGEISSETNKDRHAIPEMVRRAGGLFRRLGTPVARQQKVEYWLDDFEIPIIGYYDYLYENFVLDLKTTFALPSKPRLSDAMQVVFYSDVLSRRPGLIYVTPRRTAVYPHNEIDIEGARRVIRQSAHALRAMLAATSDREHAASLFVPNPDDFRWTDVTRAAAERIWL